MPLPRNRTNTFIQLYRCEILNDRQGTVGLDSRTILYEDIVPIKEQSQRAQSIMQLLNPLIHEHCEIVKISSLKCSVSFPPRTLILSTGNLLSQCISFGIPFITKLDMFFQNGSQLSDTVRFNSSDIFKSIQLTTDINNGVQMREFKAD